MAEDPLTARCKWLEKQCGFRLPTSLVQLARFLMTDGRGLLDELKLRATGPLAMLLAQEAPSRLDDPTGLNIPFLEARHARDLPELFTFLEGREDGLHWGLLWDRPADPPRGVASFCSQDQSPLRLHAGVYAAVLDIIADQLAMIPEQIEDDPDHEAEHKARIPVLRNRDLALRAHATKSGVSLEEQRGRGLASDTGLDLITPPSPQPPSAGTDGLKRLEKPADIKAVCQAALSGVDHGRPYDAILVGRSLFFWKDASHRETAGVLLDRGYAAIGNHALARVLAAHLEQLEDLEGVHSDDSDVEEEEEEPA